VRLSFSTLGCPAWDLGSVIDAAGRLGYDGVELRFLENDDALWARPELTGAGLPETVGRLRDAGLAVSCVDTRSFLHHPEGAARETALEEALRSLELAARLGAPGIRVFGDRVQPGQDRESTRGLIADGLGRLGEAAEGHGVEVWLESHGDFARARDTLSALDGVRPLAVGVLWDPANAFEVGESPAEGLDVLGDRVRHVHLKDVAREAGGDGRFVPRLPGQGEFGPGQVLASLRARGYDRWVSFEWEKRWYPALEEPEVALPHFVRWTAAALRDPAPAPGPLADAPRPRTLSRGRLEVEVHAGRPAMGRAAAEAVSAHLRRQVAREGRAAAIFASAPSQNEFLAALRDDDRIPWDRVTAFHLDEYIGVGPGHPASFRRFLVDRLFAHVPLRAFQGLAGEAADPVAECARYAGLLRAERPSLAVLGIGENGHLAFIDPPMCDFFEPADVRVVELDEPCRNQMVHDGCFPTLEEVPPTALSLTIPFLLRVPSAIAIVPGPAKRAAIAAALDGPVSCACPASVLRRHPDARLYLDEASAAGLADPRG
jgi:glucosamine-6-phosphate deaminase